MDIISEIGYSRNYALHTHTQFCDGHAPMEEFAAMANRLGFTHYGFSPHSPIPIQSPCNMRQEDVLPYLAEVDRLQAKYPDIKFYASMEIDYLDPEWGPSTPYFSRLPLDYRIGSVHFIPNQEGEYIDIDGRFERFKRNLSEKSHDDLRYVVDTFFAQSHAMVEAGGFDIIGHLDKIKHNAGLAHPGLENEEWYSKLANDLIDHVLEKKYIIEINTKAWKEHQQMFPSQRHWRRLLEAGAPIVVNSDAHYPALINASRKETLAALDYLRSKSIS